MQDSAIHPAERKLKLYEIELGSRLLLGTARYPSPAMLAEAVRASGAGAVAYVAHVFGFIAGAIIGLIVRAASPPPQYPVHPRNR